MSTSPSSALQNLETAFPTPSPYDSSGAHVRQAFKVFQGLVGLGESYARQGQHQVATVCAQIAAEFAFAYHPGLFASQRLERLLLTIGAALVPASPSPSSGCRGQVSPKRVLHVLTTARNTGGDTRFAWRWIAEDSGRHHAVALTRQRKVEAPPPLLESITAAGGTLHVLDATSADALSCARSLRALASSVDLVALHLLPHDVVPLLAFADRDGLPPIAFVNHADHAFWLGITISDLVIQLRESASHLSQRRRGIDANREALLPTPLGRAGRERSRSQAKEKLGYSEDVILLLSIAHAFKYDPFVRPGFVEAIMPVLKRHPNAVLIAIGPDSRDQWKAGNELTGGRVIALGKRSDTALFYDAADIYLDSFPFSSTTSLLEAGSRGIPLVSYYPHPPEAEVLGAGAPGLTPALIQVTDRERYVTVLSHLIEDPGYRQQLGERTAESVLGAHTGPGWNHSLQEVYRKAAAVRPITLTSPGTDECRTGALDILLSRLYYAPGELGGSIDRFAYLLPYPLRLRLLFRLLKWTRSFSFSMFLPPGVDSWASGRLSWLRRLPGLSQLGRAAR